MSQLARIQRGRTPMPPRILIYGTEGIGKSTFASESPKPIFLQTEDGLGEIEWVSVVAMPVRVYETNRAC